MRLEKIAVRILVNSAMYGNEKEAQKGLESEFKAHFPQLDYDQWNKDVPDSLVENIVSNVGKNGKVSVRFIIKDLHTIISNL